MFLSRLAFLVSFTDPNKQLPNVKSACKPPGYWFRMFKTLLGIEILFIKQCRLEFTSGSTWWSAKVGAKLLPNLVIFSIFSADIPLHFYESIRVVPLKYLMNFLAGINAK